MTAPALRNALTVDVEDYYHVAAFSSVIAASQWQSFPSRVQRNTETLLELFAARGRVRATFFVLGWVAERHPGLIRTIKSQGHEIACHGYSHRLVFEQSLEEFREETVRSKHLLEDIAGCRVRGYRASTYSITHASLWALDVLCEAGFEYDSSIFPIAHDIYGIPGSQRAPYRAKSPNGSEIVEFPMSTAQLMGRRVPVSGGGYFRLLPYWITRWGLRQNNLRDREPFVFYLHPWEVDPEQPRVAASWKSRFRHYQNLSQCLPRLRRLLDDFEFTAMEDVLADRGLLGSR